ncbi:hypothetical protein HYDPIDRAFT_108245 [Hydnomerulius pinastri MD-312]|nr:hypothetical protein HYDPIDRAFT_108245 [Hydnomerulius pinastri MD-312]
MKASDVPHVRALHSHLLPVSYPPTFFVQLLVNPRHICLVAADGGSIIGFASAAVDASQPSPLHTRRHKTHPDREGSDDPSDIPRAHITLLTLGVLPSYQRQGIGRALVHEVVRRLQTSSCGLGSYRPAQDDAQTEDSKMTVLVKAQVAHSNTVGKCFYTHLGMMGQRVSDDPRLNFGLAARTSTVAGVLCI